MEVVENVLASSSSSRYEQELARDSSAAVSVVSWEQRYLGAALSSDDGSPRLIFRVLQALVESHARHTRFAHANRAWRSSSDNVSYFPWLSCCVEFGRS